MINSIPYVQPYARNNRDSEEKLYFNKYIDPSNYDLKPVPNENIPTNINTYSQIYTHYINVDSAQRNKVDENIYSNEIINLPPYPLRFINSSPIVTIELPNHQFKPDDRIALNNIVSKNNILQNVIMVKKNSMFVRFLHPNHGLSLYGLYQPNNITEFIQISYVELLPTNFGEMDNIPDFFQYYILERNAKLNFTINLSNIKGSNFTRTSIGNIPINFLNNRHTVYLLFIKNGNIFTTDPNSYLIKLKKKSSINYMDGISRITDKNGFSTTQISTNSIFSKYNNLYGIPINYINSGTPIGDMYKFPYKTIIETTENSFSIDLGYPAIVDPNINFYDETDITDYDLNANQIISANTGGGTQGYIRKINHTIREFSNPNMYIYELQYPYKNIIQARIVGSLFPNSQRIIHACDDMNNIGNNKLYWRNLDDENYIYQLDVPPGNYSPEELSNTLEKIFNQTIKYRYTKEYANDIYPNVIEHSTPTNNLLYDHNGIYKYHIITVDISNTTDVITFASYSEIIQKDNNIRVIDIPTTNATMNIGGNLINSIDPINDILFIYLTSESYYQLDTTFPYINNNLYIGSNINITNNTANITMNLDMQRAILINFNDPSSMPIINSQNIFSINTNTILLNFNYNYLIREVIIPNNRLKIGDLIITDKFDDPKNLGIASIYEISSIIDTNKFTIIKIPYGTKYKFIYKNLAINFNNSFFNQLHSDSTFIITSIVSNPINNNLMIVYHPNHQLKSNDVISITSSQSINNVPLSTINRQHVISEIINDDKYTILLNPYIPTNIMDILSDIPNIVIIRYPTFFQLLFNYPDTLGNILNFNDVGNHYAITEYNHIIKNTDSYEINNNNNINTTHNNKINKLSMTGNNYFYICCPELCHIQNTSPVQNVFAIIRWTENPGNIAIDSFVPTNKIFPTPLASLSELHISCRHPDGSLVNFNGLNHSFVIELTEIFNQPEFTDTYARMNAVVLTNRV